MPSVARSVAPQNRFRDREDGERNREPKRPYSTETVERNVEKRNGEGEGDIDVVVGVLKSGCFLTSQPYLGLARIAPYSSNRLLWVADQSRLGGSSERQGWLQSRYVSCDTPSSHHVKQVLLSPFHSHSHLIFGLPL